MPQKHESGLWARERLVGSSPPVGCKYHGCSSPSEQGFRSRVSVVDSADAPKSVVSWYFLRFDWLSAYDQCPDFRGPYGARDTVVTPGVRGKGALQTVTCEWGPVGERVG